MSPGDLVEASPGGGGFLVDPDVERWAPSVPVPSGPGVVLVSRSRWDRGLPWSRVLWGAVALWVPTAGLRPAES